jgi:biopolymer transport protein ExbD
MKIKKNDQKRSRIEMIPLIDVVFLLLVFFIYAMVSMVIHKGINVNLPKAKSAVVDRKDYVSLTITENGEIYLDDMKTSLKDMEILLQRRRKDSPDLRVYIKGDKRAFYEKIIEVLDLVRESGLSKVSLETTFEERKQIVRPGKK